MKSRVQLSRLGAGGKGKARGEKIGDQLVSDFESPRMSISTDNGQSAGGVYFSPGKFFDTVSASKPLILETAPIEVSNIFQAVIKFFMLLVTVSRFTKATLGKPRLTVPLNVIANATMNKARPTRSKTIVSHLCTRYEGSTLEGSRKL
jgi:hypothetical protein